MSRARLATVTVAASLIAVAIMTGRSVVAHEGKEQAAQHRYEGPAYTLNGAAAPTIEFDSFGVQLQAWLPLGEFDEAIGTTVTQGNDLWGYVSPSGGEYAIVGTKQGVAFVDVTTPSAPAVIAGFSGQSTIWRDVKTYDHYAYVVTGVTTHDFSVFDLAKIDQGVVTLANTLSSGSTHNVAIDNESGFLYRLGSTSGDAQGLMIYDLAADPVDPPLVGQWSDRYVHDAQAVTYSDGPYADRQIVFAFAEDNTNGGNPGLDILDVTDKANIKTLSSLNYSNGNYSHQGWLSPDRKYLYLNDEQDERDNPHVNTTTTRIINVEDLDNPIEVGTFTNGNTAIDHNLFVAYDLIFEANYRSGLRVFDASDPQAPVEIGHFDTFPADDATDFSGLWSSYPFFPSGTVIGSDFVKGLFVWTVDGHDPRGDVNLDFQFDARDIDSLWVQVHDWSGEAIFDLDDDGDVDHGDLTFLVRDQLGSEWGDANLDGLVDEGDLDILRLNWKAHDAGWAGADFNGDGLVNIADLTITAEFWQHGVADPTSPLDLGAFLAEVNQVPEPTTGVLLMIGAVGPLLVRRRSVRAAALYPFVARGRNDHGDSIRQVGQ